ASRFGALAPGIFLWQQNGVTRAGAQNSDYSTNGPAGSGQRPLKLGEAGILYVGGLGATDISLSDSAAAPGTALARALANVQVYVNGVAQNTFFAGLTPGQFGLYQVNFILEPATPVPDGDQSEVWLRVNGSDSARARISLMR